MIFKLFLILFLGSLSLGSVFAYNINNVSDVEYYNFDSDYTGYFGNDLLTDGSIISNSIFQKGTGSSFYDGINDNADRNSALLSGINTGSIIMWINPTTIANTDTIYEQGYTGTDRGIRIFFDSSNRINFAWSTTSTAYQEVLYYAVALSTSSWQHIAFTRDGTFVRFYLNGVKQTLTRSAGSASSSNWRGSTTSVGAYYNSQGAFYNGYIDDLLISTDSKSSSQILDIYNNGITIITSSTPTPEIKHNITDYYNSENISIFLNTSTNTDMSYYLDSGSTTAICSNCNSTTLSLNSLSEGLHNITFISTGESGQVNSTANFTIDLTNPVISVIGGIIQGSFEVDFSTIFNITDSLSGVDSCIMNITYLEEVAEFTTLINCTDSYNFTLAGLYNGFLTATDNAGNIGTLSINGSIEPIVYIFFEDNITSNPISNYNINLIYPNSIEEEMLDTSNPINISPVVNGELLLGTYILEFTKFGYVSSNISFVVNATSGGTNHTYNIQPVTIYVDVFDITNNVPLTFDVIIENATNIESFSGLSELNKLYSQIPTGDFKMTIEATGYANGVYYNTISPYTSLTYNVYLTPENDTNIITFTVQNYKTGSVLSDVLIEARKIIDDERVTVQQVLTSSSGNAYLYLDSLENFEFVFSKDDYVEAIIESIPSTTSYTIKLKQDITDFEFTDDVSYKFLPSNDVLYYNDTVTFYTYVTGTSITSISYVLVLSDGTVLNTLTSTNPTGYTFRYPLFGGYTIPSNISYINMSFTYIRNGLINTYQKTYNIYDLSNTELGNLKENGSDNTEEFALWKLFIIISVFVSVAVASTNLMGSRDYVSIILIFPVLFFMFINWLPYLYGTVLLITLIIFYMGGNKR